MITDMSEPGGSFRSDNLLSNELGFQYPVPELQRTIRPGGVYMGVGPEQNFTYIVALQPKLVFIVDIRHDAMLQHLWYKALFELYGNRADFLSRLFARPRPQGLDTSATVDALFDAYEQAPADLALFNRTFAAITDRLIHGHSFALSTEDTVLMRAIYDEFYRGGPAINYSYCGGSCASGGAVISGRGGGGATYHRLMVATDGDGRQRSFLATEANFRAMRDLEGKNLLVPLTGNFGGPKAIRAVGAWLTERHATVTAFYTSNVEQYLFQDNIWREYYANVATLPLDSTSTFIRSRGGGGASSACAGNKARAFGGGGRGGGGLNTSVLSSITGLLKSVADGKIACYPDVLNQSH